MPSVMRLIQRGRPGISVCVLLISLLAAAPVHAYLQQKPQDMPLSAEARDKVLDGALAKIGKYYVSRPLATQIIQAIIELRRKGQYASISSAETLIPRFNADLLAISHDPHLRLGYSFDPNPVQPDDHEDTPAEREVDRQDWARHDFGVNGVQLLSGNVGYLDINGFADPEFAGDAVEAAFALLHNSDGLIIDLRQSGGGSPEMVLYLLSHFIQGDPVHISDTYTGSTDQTRQNWSLPLPGSALYLQKPVYILTSKGVFSAAEGFAYDMQALHRATLVGEVTRGGANPGKFFSIDEHFAIFVPVASVTSAITGTNWEGKGVTPDLAVPATEALDVAHARALQALLAATTDKDRKQELQDALDALPSAVKPH